MRLAKFLKLHGELALAHFILREDFEMASEAKFFHCRDEPLGRVILVPLDGVAVVHWKLMMEVMVTFTNGNESSNEVITRRVLVIERSVAEPMRKGIDAESGLSLISPGKD